MTDLQQTWLEKESHGDPKIEEGAHLLRRKINDWVQHLNDSGLASPYALSALWELTEQIGVWCGEGDDRPRCDFVDVP